MALFKRSDLEAQGLTKDQIEYIRANNLLPEALVDEINDTAAEIFGDILIEEADIGYQIIEEYRSIFK